MDASAAQELLRDVGIVVRASWAVSSSPPIHRYPEYVQRVRAAPRRAENPAPPEILAHLARAIAQTSPAPGHPGADRFASFARVMRRG